MLDSSISVVFTEYQLLQAESLCYKYNFVKTDLLVADPERINERLINADLFDNIYYLPAIYENGSIYKLSYKYIKMYEENVQSLIKSNNYYKVIIGASDENTSMGIIKSCIHHEEYWSIEDGIGNYRKFSALDRGKIFFKKLLFNHVYKFDIGIIAQKGDCNNSKSFRIDPDLTVNKGFHIDLSTIILEYLKSQAFFYKNLISSYKDYDTLVIVDKEIKNPIIKENTSLTLIKKHPKYIGSNKKFTVQNIPIEVLPIIFKNIKLIIYDSYYCSSILNILSIYNNINIKMSFDVCKKYKNNKSILILNNMICKKYKEKIFYKNV